jgi:hypothetical protein
MTPQEAMRELHDMPTNGDQEILHDRAEQILCRVLEQLGHREVSEAFQITKERVGFWYA